AGLYTFKVQGADKDPFGTAIHKSQFSEPVSVVAGARTRSVRNFFSDVHPLNLGLFAILRKSVLSVVRSLRALMGILAYNKPLTQRIIGGDFLVKLISGKFGRAVC